MIPARLRAGLIIGAVALSSALAGAAIDRSFIVRRARDGNRSSQGPGRSGPEQDARRRQQMLERLGRDLQLTDVQRAGIDSIMQRTDSSFRLIRREMQPRLQQVFERSRAEINEKLTPEQRATFAKRGRGGPRGGRDRR